MKNTVQYKGTQLMKTSVAYKLYHTWKAIKDEAKKTFEEHFKQVMTNYDLVTK